jgi:hypothetical protein
MKLLIVTVNYRTPAMTLESVAALRAQLRAFPDAQVVIVDNDSGDDSLEVLRDGVDRAGWGESVEVLASPWNGGFAWGNNWAIRRALEEVERPDYVYLLNSDAYPDTRGVEALVDHLERNPAVGIAGSFVHGIDGATHRTAFRFPSIASEFETAIGIGLVSKLLARHIVSPELPRSTTRVDWLAGASMLIRREVFEDVGLMDEGFFLYYEETDFCRRAQQAGWPTAYVIESSISHIGSVSTGIQDLSKPTPTFWYASRHRYFRKHHGRTGLWVANFAYVLGGLIRRARSFLMRRPSHEPRGHMRGFLRFNLQPGPKASGHPPRPDGV